MLSNRDEQIIKAVSYYKYVTAEDICYHLFKPTSISHVREILTRLTKAKALTRFHLPHISIGNTEYVYTTGQKPLSYTHLIHALTLTRLLIAMQKLNPLQMKISYELKPVLVSKDAIPDAWILLERNGHGQPILIEIDRGTEMQKQFKKHIANRIEFVRSGKYEEVFGEKAVIIVYISPVERVVTKSRSTRIGTMQKWCREVLREQNRESWMSVFRFVALDMKEVYQTDLLKCLLI